MVDKLSTESGQSRDVVRKKVYNWTKGTFIPRREEIFQICFVLKLSLEETDKLLLSISETGIHYRNPKELIYVYGLKNKMSWQEVSALRDRLMLEYEQGIDREALKEERGLFTRHVEIDFHENVQSEEDLRNFLIDKASDLGSLRKTVYVDFVRMMGILQKGEADARKLSVEELTNTYIEKLPKQTKRYDYLVKVIKRNWPSKDKLYKMLEGTKSINRKTMLLLFLITEEFMGEELSSGSRIIYYDTEDLSPKEQLQIRIQAMNLYLDSYGMNRLDLGNPFDCMVLYALKASYEESMSDRFKEILEMIFE